MKDSILDQFSTEDSMPTRLIGHDQILEQMLTAAATDRLHHGWILSGPKGIGKARLALEVAAQLLSQIPEGDSLFGDGASGAGLSESDRNLVYKQTHPDFLYVSADRTEANKSGQIRVEQIRKVNQFMANSSARGGWRIVIIDSMDEVNINGANALLKILEEPPQKAILLLLASAKGRLLPTIRSRCRVQTVSALTNEDTHTVLQEIYKDADAAFLSSLAILSSGAPGQAMALADAGALEAYEQTCSILAHKRSALSEVMRLGALWGEGGVKAAPKRVAGLYLFDRLLSAAALSASSKIDLSNYLPYEREAITHLAKSFTSMMLAELHHEANSVFQDSAQFYLDAAAVFQPFLLKIHGKT